MTSLRERAEKLGCQECGPEEKASIEQALIETWNGAVEECAADWETNADTRPVIHVNSAIAERILALKKGE